MIGCGSIVSKKTLAIVEAGNSRLVAVMSHSIDKDRSLAEKYGAPRYYYDRDLLLRNEDVDVVFIDGREVK
ncbi:hypothetical protein DRO37_00755 [Candidatus Bathyarchaeota archaeon]|nr:MAG: hypothetical protein DRO37_00755 [Candidatus Bathyarchaeota archaeon]